MYKFKDLQAKEAALMRQVAKMYDNKQHKKGLKTTETVLKKYPDFGEALAMKALFLSGLERREEAHECVKKAIKNDIGNHMCWHAYGLIHRAEKNYEEGAKCYAQAVRIDRENVGIYREMASMHCQLRQFDSYLEDMMQLVALRANVKQFWLGLATAFHLANNLEAAISTMEFFTDIFMNHVERGVDYENSEAYMYRAMLLEESGNMKGALELLDSNEKSILDKKSMKETKARLLLALGETRQAEVAYKILFNLNPDNHDALEGLLKSKNLFHDLDESKASSLFELFEDLIDQHRRSNLLKRIPLNYATGDRFSRMMDSYLRFNFQKGVPSLFVAIRALYADPEKLSKIESLCLSYVKNLLKHSLFSEPTIGDGTEDVVLEPPSAILWVYYFLAQHYDFLKDYDLALEFVEKAILHTPTLVELFMTKAKILKHVGAHDKAMETMNAGRLLDLQDRCINTKCVKYMLRAGNVEDAEKTVVLFCRTDSNDKLSDLVDMQANWYIYEAAKAHVSKGEFGKALKRFQQIDKNFSEYYDDQYDFHGYSMRKGTVRSYINMYRMEDRLRSHPFFFNGAIDAIRLLVFLHDQKVIDDKKKSEEMSQMSEADRKKALRKARKAELKSGGGISESNDSLSKNSSSSLVTAAASSNSSSSAGGGKKKSEDDPDGVKLLSETNFLEEAVKFLKPLLELSANKIESHVLAVAVYLRRKNYLLAARSLLKGRKIDANHPDLYKQTIELMLAANDASMNEIVKSIVTEALESIVGAKFGSFKEFSMKFAKDNAKSLLHLQAYAEGVVKTESEALPHAVEAIVALIGDQATKVSIEDTVFVHKGLVKLNASQDQVHAFVKHSLARFPLSSYFIKQ